MACINLDDMTYKEVLICAILAEYEEVSLITLEKYRLEAKSLVKIIFDSHWIAKKIEDIEKILKDLVYNNENFLIKTKSSISKFNFFAPIARQIDFFSEPNEKENFIKEYCKLYLEEYEIVK